MCNFLLSYVFFGIILCSPLELIKKIDQLDSNSKYDQELIELDKAINSYPNNIDLLWRLSRVHFEIADQSDKEEVHRKHFYPGLDYAKQALKINQNSAKANHWYAVLIGKIGLLEGTEQKIKNSYEVKKYALKAINLDPNYDGTYHVMGRWHYEIASLSWFERKIAALVYAIPPDGSYEEAVYFFKKAIESKDNEIRHYYWLSKTFIKIDKLAEAKKYLKKILLLQSFDNSDRSMQLESKKLLNDL